MTGLTKQNTRIAVIGPGGFVALSVAEILALPDAPVVDEEKTTDPPPVVPIPVDPKPVPVEPIAPAIAVTELVGVQVDTRYGNPVYHGIGQDVRYEIEGDKLWPRGTPTNPSPAPGGVGVPLRYVVPEGWDWEIAASGDGAWSIVPRKTGQSGPEWLRNVTPTPTVPVVTPTAPTALDDEDVTYKQA